MINLNAVQGALRGMSPLKNCGLPYSRIDTVLLRGFLQVFQRRVKIAVLTNCSNPRWASGVKAVPFTANRILPTNYRPRPGLVGRTAEGAEALVDGQARLVSPFSALTGCQACDAAARMPALRHGKFTPPSANAQTPGQHAFAAIPCAIANRV